MKLQSSSKEEINDPIPKTNSPHPKGRSLHAEMLPSQLPALKSGQDPPKGKDQSPAIKQQSLTPFQRAELTPNTSKEAAPKQNAALSVPSP